jgi:hypothetical protein
MIVEGRSYRQVAAGLRHRYVTDRAARTLRRSAAGAQLHARVGSGLRASPYRPYCEPPISGVQRAWRTSRTTDLGRAACVAHIASSRPVRASAQPGSLSHLSGGVREPGSACDTVDGLRRGGDAPGGLRPAAGSRVIVVPA